jgi:DNA-directed RNA polymerase subunit RPC12/RpoP
MAFSWLRDYMQKGGLVLSVYKCPSCGGQVKIPDKGNSAKCEHCGANVLVTDVFEKVKQFIE